MGTSLCQKWPPGCIRKGMRTKLYLWTDKTHGQFPWSTEANTYQIKLSTTIDGASEIGCCMRWGWKKLLSAEKHPSEVKASGSRWSWRSDVTWFRAHVNGTLRPLTAGGMLLQIFFGKPIRPNPSCMAEVQKLRPLPVRIGGRGQRLSDHCGWLRRAAGPAGLGLDTVDIVHRYR